MAWIIDTGTRTVEPLDYSNAREYGELDKLLIVAAYDEAIHPKEYNFVKEILGAENTLHVAPFTVKKTKDSVYKVWVCDMEEKKGTGVRFYNTDAVLYGKLLLVKYGRVIRPELDFSKILEYVEHPDMPLFYELGQIKECDMPDVYWVEEDVNIPQHTFSFDFANLHSTDLMYTCASCGSNCSKCKCSKCKQVYYCNVECQRKHWKEHKEMCE